MSSLNQSIYQSDQGATSFNKLCAIVGSLILVLLALLQVKYENKDASPFETHCLVMMLFIVTMVTNALVAVATITVQAWFTCHSLVPFLNQIFIAFEVLACDLLLLILAPPVGYFFLVIWVILLVLVMLYNVSTLSHRQFLHSWAVYNTVQNLSQRCMVQGAPLPAAPQASGASPMARTSVGLQDGVGDISIEIMSS